MGNQDGFPTVKDYQDILVVYLSSPVDDPSWPRRRLSWLPRTGAPCCPGCPGEGPPRSPSGGPQGSSGPPGGGSLGPPGDLGSQGPPRQLFIWQSGSALDQIIVDMNRSVMQLLATQQADNVQLQLQTEQNWAVWIAHTDALRSLAESTQQRNFEDIYASILTYDGTNKGGFFKWVERLEPASLQNGRDIYTEVLDKAEGNVRTCLMGLPVNLLWSTVWQEVKGCFSNLPTVAHAAMRHNTIMQKPSGSLDIYVSRYSRLHYAATNETVWENTDPMKSCHFVTSINSTSIADKICIMPWKHYKMHLTGLLLLKLVYSWPKVYT